MRKQFSEKESLLVIYRIFGLFVNILTVGHKFSPLRDKLTRPIQMELSKRQNAFSEYFLDLWNVHKNAFSEYFLDLWNIHKKFPHFQKKDYRHS